MTGLYLTIAFLSVAIVILILAFAIQFNTANNWKRLYFEARQEAELWRKQVPSRFGTGGEKLGDEE